MAAAPQALLPEQQVSTSENMDIDGEEQLPELPHYVIDNLPCSDFDLVVNCRHNTVPSMTSEQFCESADKPNKVLINAQVSSPVALEQLLQAYLSVKEKHPEKQAVIITSNALTSSHKTLQTLQHTYTVGLRNKRCKIWHDPPSVLTNKEQLSSIFKGAVSGANANIMLDTGSAANCISKRFCELMKIRVHRFGKIEMTTACGQTTEVSGLATVTLALQGYKTKMHLLVIPMAPDSDVILGEPWHRTVRAVKQYDADGLSIVRIHKGRTMRKIVRHPKQNPIRFQTNLLLSHAQFNRARNKNGFFVAHINLVPGKPGGDDEQNTQQNTQNTEQNTPSLASDHNSKMCPEKLKQLLDEYKMVFEPLPKQLPPFRDITGHTIPLQPGASPPYRAPYRLSPLELKEVKKQIQELLENKFIQPSRSPYGSPVLFVQKKDGTLRMCIDYRALNKLTIHDKYPLPRTDELLDKVKGASIFSSLDLTSGYHQIRIHPDDVPKTAFTAAGEHYEFRVLPFGLTNAPSTFQRCMNSLFKHLPFVAVYLDDILIFSKTAEEHLDHLKQVLQIIKQESLFCKLKKCEFNQTELKFVGHIVGAKGIRPDPEKLSAVTGWPAPHNIHELRKFLGFTNYFRKFLQGYSQRTAPLTNLLRKNVAYEWTKICQESFDQLKIDLTSAPVLVSPDTTQSYELIADACGTGIGSVLLQNEKPIAFESRKFNPAEQNYTVTEQELLAIIHSLMTWRYLLEGLPKEQLKLVTDHSPLTFMPTVQNMSRRQVRWSEILQRYPCTWEHRAGKNNVADPISRRPGQAQTIPITAVTRGTVTPVTITPFQDEIIAGYDTDPWFAETQNTNKLSKIA